MSRAERAAGPDGVRIVRDPGAQPVRARTVALLVGLLLAISFGSLLVLGGSGAGATIERAAPQETTAGVTREQAPPMAGSEKQPGREVTRPTARELTREVTPPAPGSVAAPAAPGSNLFPDQKRRPFLIGNLVPDGFVLPPGYLRHYQTAHFPDGLGQLPPILMYDFGFQPLDREGRPLPVPEDRVVPEDRLPEGLPVQRLEIPASETEGEEP